MLLSNFIIKTLNTFELQKQFSTIYEIFNDEVQI